MDMNNVNHSPERATLPSIAREGYENMRIREYDNMKTAQHSPERAELTNVVREGYDAPQLNEHNKAEYPPMHTVEHILNQTMVRIFGCGRSRNAHIERKKSKCDYTLPCAPSEEQIAAIEQQVNDVISQNLPVTIEFVTRENVPDGVDLSKLPADASETQRIVRVGDYDVCACIGTHVENTSEIGRFRIISHTFENGTLRLRFKLEQQ